MTGRKEHEASSTAPDGILALYQLVKRRPAREEPPKLCLRGLPSCAARSRRRSYQMMSAGSTRRSSGCNPYTGFANGRRTISPYVSCASQTPFQPPMSVSCARWLIWKDAGGLHESSLAEPTCGDLGTPMPLSTSGLLSELRSSSQCSPTIRWKRRRTSRPRSATAQSRISTCLIPST